MKAAQNLFKKRTKKADDADDSKNETMENGDDTKNEEEQEKETETTTEVRCRILLFVSFVFTTEWLFCPISFLRLDGTETMHDLFFAV